MPISPIALVINDEGSGLPVSAYYCSIAPVLRPPPASVARHSSDERLPRLMSNTVTLPAGLAVAQWVYYCYCRSER